MANGHRIEFTSKNTVYFDKLAFTKVELRELVRKWNNLEPILWCWLKIQPTVMSDMVPLTDRVADTIFDLTAGHVGLSRKLMEEIAERFLSPSYYKGPYPISESEIIAYLQRYTPFTFLYPPWAKEDEEVLRYILAEGALEKDAHPERSESFARLTVSGIVAERLNSEGMEIVTFAAPLLAREVKTHLPRIVEKLSG